MASARRGNRGLKPSSSRMRRPSRRASKARAALGVRAVGRRRPDRGKQRRQVGGFVVDHVVDAVRGRRGVEHARDRLRHVGVVAQRHALARGKHTHERERLLDVGVAVAIDERQSKDAHVEALDGEEKALGGELADRVGRGWGAGVVFLGKAAAVRTVDQARARENEPLHGGGTRRAREVLRPKVVDCLRLFGGRAPEEGCAMDHGIDIAHSGRERVGVQQITWGDLDAGVTQAGAARRIANQGSHAIPAPSESSGQSAPHLSGGSSDEDLHVPNIDTGPRRGLEKPDTRA